MTPTANKNTLSAGEEVVVTISLDEDIKDIVTLNYKLYFDDSVFELTKTEQVNQASMLQQAKIRTKTARSITSAAWTYSPRASPLPGAISAG